MHKEFNFIKHICIKNGYPTRFINSQIKKTLERYFDKINGTNIYSSKKTNNEN